MSERKLATVRTVAAVDAIPNADAIEVVTVDGWKIVTKKGEFKVGDSCVYFEIDSLLPEGDPRWSFLMSRSTQTMEVPDVGPVTGHRLRTIKLRGQVSQGLVLPVDEFPELEHGHDDLAECLGVYKYERPLSKALAGQARGFFPSFICKTDQERCQNIGHVIFHPNELENEYEITLKLDGSSITIFRHNDEIGVCSRNLQLKTEEGENEGNLFVQMFRKSGLPDALRAMQARGGPNIAIQGELMGPQIQGNREQFADTKMFVFDIFNIDEQRYLTPQERYDMYVSLQCDGLNQDHVQHVPIEVTCTLNELAINNVADLLKYAEGPSIKHPVREGLVFKSKYGDFSFKAISNTFLLKEKD
jgi:RNA ligase (TIGR02306 family)